MWVLLFRTMIILTPFCVLLILLFREQLRLPWWVIGSVYAVLTVGAVFLGRFIVSSKNRFSDMNSFYTLGFLCLMALFFSACMEFKVSQMVFITYIFANYEDIVDLCIVAILYMQTGQVPHFADSVPALVLQVMLNLVLLPFLWIFMRYVLKPTLDFTRHLSFWRFLWGIPFCFLVIFRTNILPNYGQLVTFKSGLFLLIPFLWIFATFFSYFFILYALRQTAEAVRLEEKLHISEVHLAAQEKQLDGLQQKIEEVRRSKHDLRHFLLSIRGHVTKQNYNNVAVMIDDHLTNLQSTETRFLCENAALNAILCYYKDLAEEHQIAFSITSDMPATFSYSETDLCIILGNLVENAVEACMRQTNTKRFVKIQLIMASGRLLTLLVENSYEGTVRRNHNDFYSSKRKGIGIGIASIRSIVQKYHGTTKFEYGDGVFKASVLVNYPKNW